uniref:Reverse transcriptase domain-containing protein n=1 Tax=Tanacetum cinerariifolium TaxID=118510 RepID=A0A699JWC5_TANCI|nr:hypothetical protein [Tanacetum cinerariifolium]
MMTARKRVRPLPIQQLVVRHSIDHSSLDSSSRHSLSNHSYSNLLSTSAEPSRKRRRSPMTSVPALPLVSEALSPVRVDLIPSPKRVRDIGYLADVEIDPRESRVESVTRLAMPEDIPEPAQEGAVDVTYETLGDLVQRFHDHTQAIPVYRVQVIEGFQRKQGHRIVGVELAVISLTERVAELERDNRRLRGTASVESQRVDRLQCGMSCMKRKMRRMRRFRFYDRVRVGRLEVKMTNTRSRASMTREEVEELVAYRAAEEIEAREAAWNLKTLNGNGDEQEGENEGIKNGGNRGNGNGDNGGNKSGGNGGNKNGGNGENGNHGMNYGEAEGVVRLTRSFEKIETVFNISNCPPKYQVKYATCTLHDSALTWWNSHKRTIGVDAAYSMKWARLMKSMTEVMVPGEEDRVERFIGGLPDNIQGNVIVANPARLQDDIRITNQLMDKKLQSYAARSAENKKG